MDNHIFILFSSFPPATNLLVGFFSGQPMIHDCLLFFPQLLCDTCNGKRSSNSVEGLSLQGLFHICVKDVGGIEAWVGWAEGGGGGGGGG